MVFRHRKCEEKMQARETRGQFRQMRPNLVHCLLQAGILPPLYFHLSAFFFLLPSFLLFVFQSLYGMQRLSTRSPPTSTSPPCRLSSPRISPSTSRPVLLLECFWRTWASRTSSEWSSAVSQRSKLE